MLAHYTPFEARELGELGFIQVQSICAMGGKAWMAVDGKKYDA